jgi:hypothetical protein
MIGSRKAVRFWLVIAALCLFLAPLSEEARSFEVRSQMEVPQNYYKYSWTPAESGELGLPTSWRTFIDTDGWDQEWVSYLDEDLDIAFDYSTLTNDYLVFYPYAIGMIAQANPAGVPCEASDTCWVRFNEYEAWYLGDASPTPTGYNDVGGVLTHELGHWLGFIDCSIAPDQSPLPYQHTDSMCFGGVNGYYQRSPSQDDLQGAKYIGHWDNHLNRRHFSINEDFRRCGTAPPGSTSGGTDCNPIYWVFGCPDPDDCDANWQWFDGDNGHVRLRPIGMAKEFWQRGEGFIIDQDNDGTFRLVVRARSNTDSNVEIDLFVRDYYRDYEFSCPVTITPTWGSYACNITLTSGGPWAVYEYGFRADNGEDVRVSRFDIRSLYD